MKTLFELSSLALIAAAMVSFTGKNPHSTTYKLDTKGSKVEWYAAKFTGKHNGTITLASGSLTDNHGQWTGTFVIDMKTITDLDMEPGKGKEKLENHLKSPDFFDAEKYPTSKLDVTSITPLAEATKEATHKVNGNLTIKDKTNPVTFDVMMKQEGEQFACTGTMKIDRSKFDVRYGSKSFFADIGDKIIYDEFELKFNVALLK